MGLILKPTNLQSLHIDCYADADFAGLFKSENPVDPHSVKSRSGYVIFVANCPILWASKLQGCIALSTMEAEYVALSTACRDLIPLRNTLQELVATFDLGLPTPPIIHSTIWEDNSGALKLANMALPRVTPKSKHFGVKYHWFRSLVTGPDGDFQVRPICTTLQRGDIFTKGLTSVVFAKIRKLIMNW